MERERPILDLKPFSYDQSMNHYEAGILIFDEKNPTSAGFQSSNLGASSSLMKISDQLWNRAKHTLYATDT